MKKTVKVLAFALLFGGLTTMYSCKKEYRKYDNNEVVENTYTGNILPTSGGNDPGGDFTGDGDSGTYSFVWENQLGKATVAFDVSTEPGGTAQIILNDAHGNEVFNKTRPEGGNDTFSGVSKKGEKGKWLVTIKLTNFDGDGSYDISPGE